MRLSRGGPGFARLAAPGRTCPTATAFVMWMRVPGQSGTGKRRVRKLPRVRAPGSAKRGGGFSRAGSATAFLEKCRVGDGRAGGNPFSTDFGSGCVHGGAPRARGLARGAPADGKLGRNSSLLLVIRSDHEGEGQALLVLVLALLVGVAGATDRVGPEKQDLSDPFIRVNLGGQGRRVTDLDGDLAAPLRFQGRYIDDYTATRICRFSDTNR